MVDPDNALATAEEEATGDLESLAELDDSQLHYLANLDQVEDPLSDNIECDEGEREETSAEEADFQQWQRELDAKGPRLLKAAAGVVRDPYSVWKPFSGKSTTALKHDIICVHTMVGTLAGSWVWASGSGRAYWHYGVNGQGVAWQCQDLRYRSAANLNGNWHVIPIETSDLKEGVFPATWQDPLWTNAQIDTLVKLIAWLCKRFGIPPVLIPDTKSGRRGLAYHRQGVNPNRVSGGELWSNAFGKSCPANRTQQFINVVIPRVQRLVAGGGDDSMSAGDVAALKQYMNEQFTQVDRAIGEVDDRTQRTLVLLRDNLLGEDTTGRVNGKSLIQGAVLDGVRPPVEGQQDRGMLRQPFKDMIREVLEEMAAEVPVEPPAPTEGGT